MNGISLYKDENEMAATLTLIVQTNNRALEIEDVISFIKKQGIVFGIDRKCIFELLQQCKVAQLNTKLSEQIAYGLSPINGQNSFIRPLVLNVFEKYLLPIETDTNEIDTPIISDNICVRHNEAIATRVLPTSGRPGKTITGKNIAPKAGKIIDVELGNNTHQSASDENLIVASIAGIPKFENGVMSIEETVLVTGVNVSTGNLTYDGAVIVNGDVSENMKIIAKGDVIVNGYVESAYVHTDGDIIITEGATGKMHDEDCQLITTGNIFIQHAQGLSIKAGKNLNVAKQLAYSTVSVNGHLSVGDTDNPMGNLFANTINCHSTVKAGSIGAISGTEILIDFSEGYNLICARLESIRNLVKRLNGNTAKHRKSLTEINDLNLPSFVKDKFQSLKDELDTEDVLLSWLESVQVDLDSRKKGYEKDALIVANKELFPGVTVKLNEIIWRSDCEYQKCNVLFKSGSWHNVSLL